MRTALAGVLLLLSLGVAGCDKEETAAKRDLSADAPPLRRPASVAYDPWIGQWSTRLPVSGTLRESRSTVNLLTTTAEARRYRLDLEIANRSGYRFDTGSNLYLIETARPKADPSVEVEDYEDDPDVPLKVAGGYFRTTPPEDFSGVAEMRPEMKNLSIKQRVFFLAQELDDEDRVGLYNSQSRLPDGTLYRKLGPSTLFGSARGGKTIAAGFGGAPDGATLRISSDLLLLVMVKPEWRDRVVAVTPELRFAAGGQRASFRYLVEFERDPTREKAWRIARATLIPMTGEVLLPIVEKADEALWRRVFCARWAGQRAGKRAMPLLQKIAVDTKENGALRAASIASLATIRDPGVYDLAVSLVASEPKASKPRLSAISLLGNLGDPRATPILLAALPSDDADMSDEGGGEDFMVVRQSIVGALGELDDKSAVDRLLRYLEDDLFPEIHSDVTEALRDLVDESHLDRLAKLARSEVTGSYEGIRLLGAVGSDRAVQLLGAFLRASDPETRTAACEALGGIDRPGAVALLRKSLDDPEDYVRTSAVAALAGLWNAERHAALHEAVSHRDLEVQRSAMTSLAQHVDADARMEIIARLRDPKRPEAIREGAASALGSYIADEEAIEILIGATSDPSHAVRIASLQSLGRLGAAKAAPAIERALADEDEEVRLAAAEALGSIGLPASRDVLLAAALKEEAETPLAAQIDALIALDYHETAAFDGLLARLGDETVRTEFERLLEQITDEDYGVGWEASEEEIAASIAEWKKWYAEKGR